jgi:hypothetical protein
MRMHEVDGALDVPTLTTGSALHSAIAWGTARAHAEALCSKCAKRIERARQRAYDDCEVNTSSPSYWRARPRAYVEVVDQYVDIAARAPSVPTLTTRPARPYHKPLGTFACLPQ